MNPSCVQHDRRAQLEHDQQVRADHRDRSSEAGSGRLFILSYPFAYGCIPRTWDEDGDPLDAEIVNVTEPLIPGSIVEARIIGIMTFDDGGEVDDKVIAVLADDKRMDHIKSEDLGDHWKRKPLTTGSTTRI